MVATNRISIYTIILTRIKIIPLRLKICEERGTIFYSIPIEWNPKVAKNRACRLMLVACYYTF